MKEQPNEQKQAEKNLLYRFDGFIKKFIPNFNVRAILYMSFIFAIAIYLQIWRIPAPSSNNNTEVSPKKETVIADDKYWQSKEYKDKIQNQTVQTFTSELQNWLQGKDQEFVKRKFEDILYINSALTPLTGGDPAIVVPQNFAYLENLAKARYQYAETHDFLSDQPTLVSLGNLVCSLDDKTEKVTDIEAYDWRYASMPKLAQFMKTKPDWKVQIGDRILDVSDPLTEDKDVLKLETTKTQPAGLFSFIIFRDSKTNRIFLADTNILENNGVDAKLTLAWMSNKSDKSPKIYFTNGYAGCDQISNLPQINYEQSN